MWEAFSERRLVFPVHRRSETASHTGHPTLPAGHPTGRMPVPPASSGFPEFPIRSVSLWWPLSQRLLFRSPAGEDAGQYSRIRTTQVGGVQCGRRSPNADLSPRSSAVGDRLPHWTSHSAGRTPHRQDACATRFVRLS